MRRRRIAGAKMSYIASACRYSWRIPVDGRGAGSDHASLGAFQPLWSEIWGAFPGNEYIECPSIRGSHRTWALWCADLGWELLFITCDCIDTDHGEQKTSANCVKLLKSKFAFFCDRGHVYLYSQGKLCWSSCKAEVFISYCTWSVLDETHSVDQEIVYYPTSGRKSIQRRKFRSTPLLSLRFPPYSRSVLYRRSPGSSSAVRQPCSVWNKASMEDQLMWEPSEQNLQSVSHQRSHLHHAPGSMSACPSSCCHGDAVYAAKPGPS